VTKANRFTPSAKALASADPSLYESEQRAFETAGAKSNGHVDPDEINAELQASREANFPYQDFEPVEQAHVQSNGHAAAATAPARAQPKKAKKRKKDTSGSSGKPPALQADPATEGRKIAYAGAVGDVRLLLSAGKLTPLRPVRGRIVIDRVQIDAFVLSADARPRRGRGIK
jgi:hypothetical protein